MSVSNIYINKKITDYIIEIYGEDGLTKIINGTLLVNDKKLNDLIGDSREANGLIRAFKVTFQKNDSNGIIYSKDAINKTIKDWNGMGEISHPKSF